MKLDLKNGKFIAYNKEIGNKKYPTVVFLGGYMSGMDGTKATAIKSYCINSEVPFIQFGYSGLGQSSGDFLDSTITTWKEDALTIIDKVTKGPIILVGSSMGGWISLLVALLRPERVVGILCLAAAPDFTKDLILDVITDSQKEELASKGQVDLSDQQCDGNFMVTQHLLEDGKNNLLLDKQTINITAPVRLIHGDKDEDVPCKYSYEISDRLTSKDVVVDILLGGDHRLTRSEDIEFILSKLADLIKVASKIEN